jgi:hypothetical protein
MNIINNKSVSAKLVSAIVIGSLLSGTLMNTSSGSPVLIREEIRSLYYSSDLIPDVIRELTPEQFGSIDCWEVYSEIFSEDDLRNAVTPEQIAAVDSQYASVMNIDELNDSQRSGVTRDQFLAFIKVRMEQRNVCCM